MDKGNVLIVRTNYRKAYPVMESLKKAGYNVFAGIDCGNTVLLSPTNFSRYIDGRVRIMSPNVSEKEYVKSIIDATKKLKIDIVCPIGFIDFMLLSKYKDNIEKYAIVPTDTYKKMSAVSDKRFLRNIAYNLGINYPRSLLLREKCSSNILYEFVNTVSFPLVIKGIGDGSKPFFCSNK